MLHEFGSTSTITEGGVGGSEHTLDIASASSGNSGGSDGISNWKRPQYSQVMWIFYTMKDEIFITQKLPKKLTKFEISGSHKKETCECAELLG